MSLALRPSAPLAQKQNVNPSLNRITEATAEDFQELGQILIDHADKLDGIAHAEERAKYYGSFTTLDLLRTSFKTAETDGWALIDPGTGSNKSIATFLNGEWNTNENIAPIQFFDTIFDRPEVGSTGIWYVVLDRKQPYLWFSNKYNAIGGERGQSALEVWQEENPGGTYEEWIESLRGLEGPAGSDANVTKENIEIALNHEVADDAVVVKGILNADGSERPKDANGKVTLSDIVDTLTSTLATASLSANQGRILKDYIDAINAILSSDDTTLDELQEVVAYIKANREDLANLGISNIAGLVAALEGKQATIPYTPANDAEVEKLANKATDLTVVDDTKYLTTKGIKDNILTSISGQGVDKGNALYIAHPEGGKTRLYSTNTAGAIQIKFPITTQSAVFSMDVHIFGRQYSTNQADGAMIHIVGESQSTTALKFSATILCHNVELDYPIRFGNDGTNYCIWIAELSHVFDYGGVGISDLFIGRVNSGTFEDWKGAFDISKVQAFGTVDLLFENNLPAGDWNNLKNNASTTLTGTDLAVSSVLGNNYNYAAPSAATLYTYNNPVINGFDRCWINAASEPVITNSISITAGTFEVGKSYRITTLGTTDFTAIGSASNTVGVIFTATGIGTGTGTASLNATKIKGSAFAASTLMEMVVSSPDGVAGEYYFAEI
jgi:hypothetical protein